MDVPHYDFATHRRTAATTHVLARSTSVIILDGIFVLGAERVAAQCDVTIFCSEDLDVCLVRRCVVRGRGGGWQGVGRSAKGRTPYPDNANDYTTRHALPHASVLLPLTVCPSPSPFSPSPPAACSLRRDLVERGRTVESVLNQYLRFVKSGCVRPSVRPAGRPAVHPYARPRARAPALQDRF